MPQWHLDTSGAMPQNTINVHLGAWNRPCFDRKTHFINLYFQKRWRLPVACTSSYGVNAIFNRQPVALLANSAASSPLCGRVLTPKPPPMRRHGKLHFVQFNVGELAISFVLTRCCLSVHQYSRSSSSDANELAPQDNMPAWPRHMINITSLCRLAASSSKIALLHLRAVDEPKVHLCSSCPTLKQGSLEQILTLAFKPLAS